MELTDSPAPAPDDCPPAEDSDSSTSEMATSTESTSDVAESSEQSEVMKDANCQQPQESTPIKTKRRSSDRKSKLKPKPEIMVFYPTWEEFKDFNGYIKYMESKGAHLAGVAKIVPPPEYKPRRSGRYDDIEMSMEPIRQNIFGRAGVYCSLFEPTKPAMSVRQFRCLAESPKYAPPQYNNFEDLEREFWRNITYKSPLYGADIGGSLTDIDYPYWNFNNLGSILNMVQTELKCDISGVNTPYLYFGMWKAAFAWHTEDVDLYSINYLHYGKPKTWYAIPPAFAQRFEELARQLYPELYINCNAFLRHKSTFISPKELKANMIPYNTITQNAGEIMITFPCGYHSGFNHGYNIAESVNFGTPRWVEYGKRTLLCKCKPDTVRIDMAPFIQRFQPERYELWLAGKDYGRHPEQTHGRLRAAPRRRISADDAETKEEAETQTPEALQVKAKRSTREDYWPFH